MEITILRMVPLRGRGASVDVRRLRSLSERALRLLTLPETSELNVVLESDEAVRRLHRRHFGKNTRTNVISFGQWEGDPSQIRRMVSRWPRGRPLPLGDVVICVDRAAAEARGGGLTVQARVSQLLVHGLLHMLGHEHERGGKKERAMQRAEARLLLKLSAGERREKGTRS